MLMQGRLKHRKPLRYDRLLVFSFLNITTKKMILKKIIFLLELRTISGVFVFNMRKYGFFN